MRNYSYDAVVVNVVDGDTVDLLVDQGFRSYFGDRFRLVDIDTPERGQPNWDEATTALMTKLPVNIKVRITTYHPRVRDPRDKFGRWLAHIFLEDGTDVNKWMVDNGYAKLWEKPRRVALDPELSF
jgi:micrococcal nuclease